MILDSFGSLNVSVLCMKIKMNCDKYFEKLSLKKGVELVNKGFKTFRILVLSKN